MNENRFVSNTLTNNGIEERPWKIKEYDNLKVAKVDTTNYYDNLKARKEKFLEIDSSLHKKKVFEGPIADDCHDNGYVKLDGYMRSLMKDVNFIYEWFVSYIKACEILEDETQTAKQTLIDNYANRLLVKNVYQETNQE